MEQRLSAYVSGTCLLARPHDQASEMDQIYITVIDNLESIVLLEIHESHNSQAKRKESIFKLYTYQQYPSHLKDHIHGRLFTPRTYLALDNPRLSSFPI